MKYSKFHTLMLLGWLLPMVSYAQLGQFKNMVDTFLVDFDSAGFLYFQTPNLLQPGGCFKYYKSGANDQDNDIELIREWWDKPLNMHHYKFQQLHKGIPVEAAECSEHFDDKGNLIFTNTKFAVNITGRSKPKITKTAALETVLKTYSGESTFAWDYPEWDLELQEETGDPNATYKPKGTLMWALDNFNNLGMYIPGSRYTLAYEFEIRSFQPDAHKAFYVDALTGQIIREDDLIAYNGPANVAYHGTQTIDTKQDKSGAFILWADDGDHNIHTKYLLNNANDAWKQIPEIEDDDDVWNLNHDTATTIHWFAMKSWDYFNVIHAYNGFDDKGNEVKIYSNSGQKYDAKYFSPTTLAFGIDTNNNSYGDAVEIVGHEFTHGIAHNTARFKSVDEPAALEESFCDIFGMMVEYFTDGVLSNWTIGNPPSTIQLRSLELPKQFGVHYRDSVNRDTIDVGQADTYLGEYYCLSDCKDPHINCGVQNKWFQLLVDGGTGVNDNNDAYSVQGIGYHKAARIAFWNLTNVMQRGSQYEDAQQGAITSAELLYPSTCAQEVIQTTNAWYAVGLGDPSTCTTAGTNEPYVGKFTYLYPNPATNQFQINDQNPGSNLFSVDLYTMDGKWIKQWKTVQTLEQLSIEGIPDGLYLVEIKTMGQIIRKKLMIHE